MKKLYLALTAAAVLLTPAIAKPAEAPVKKPEGIQSSVTINECLMILQALNNIDEHIVIVGKEPNQQLVKQSYEYGPGGFRLNFLAHNIRILTTIQQDAQAEQQKILRDILAKMPPVALKDKDGKETGDTKPAFEIQPNTPEAIEYDKKLKELTAAPCLADLTHFREGDLKLEKNELPASSLSSLDKIRDK